MLKQVCIYCEGHLFATGGRDDQTGELWVRCENCDESGYVSEMEKYIYIPDPYDPWRNNPKARPMTHPGSET